MEDARVERWGLAAAALGVLLWCVSPLASDLAYDANAYVAMAHGWARTGELVMQWGDVLTFAPAPPGHSHHFPPAYPVYLGLVFRLAGYGLWQAKLASVAASVLALGVVYLTTRDLYGRTAGAVVAGIVALDPHLLWVTAMGLSEALALAFFALTLWAILRSLADERFIVLAGIFAGLAYLSRASMGAFFLIAGGAGLAWRLAHRGVRGTASPWYGLAILVFGTLVGLWAWRNVHLFGWPNWETSVGSRGIPRWVADHPREFLLGLLVRAPLLASVAAPLLVLLWPRARASLRQLRDERVSALWLAAGLVWLLGLLFSAAYFSMGPSRYEALRLDNARYVLVGLVPLAWALARGESWSDARARRRWLALGAAFLAASLAVLAYPLHYLPTHGAAMLEPHLRAGDEVAVAGAGKYAFYAYVPDPAALTVYADGYAPDRSPEFILATYPFARDGYVRVHHETQRHPYWLAEDDVVEVHARADVAAERGLAPS